MRLALLVTVTLALGTTVVATPTGAAAPGSVDLAPVADTDVEAGTQARWDHGLADHLDVDQSPTALAYLKFDLSAVTAPVTRATLTLFCRDASSDGGTVYPVVDSRWVEGTHSGANSTSANGPGLKWADLDTNSDGTLDARDASPYVPDFARPVAALGSVTAGHTVTVDVTAAFQAGLRQAKANATSSARRKKPAISSDCAAALENVADRVAAGLQT